MRAVTELAHVFSIGLAQRLDKVTDEITGKGLRAVRAEPGAARNQPMEAQGLAACVQTRWKDARVTFDGPPPSIN